MGQSLLRVLVDERAGRDEVAGHPLGIPRVEASERTPDRRVEVADVDPLGQLRPCREGRAPVGAIVAGTAARGAVAPAVAGWLAVLPGGSVRPRPVCPRRTVTTVPGRSARGRRSCHCGRSVACERSPPGRAVPPLSDGRLGGRRRDVGPATAADLHRAGGRPAGLRSCHGADARHGRGRSPAGVGPATAAGLHARAVTGGLCGPATRGRAATAGRSPDGLRSCHAGRAPRSGGHRRASVLPLRPISTLRAVAARACGPATPDAPPVGTVTGGDAPVLPRRPISTRAVTGGLRSCHAGRAPRSGRSPAGGGPATAAGRRCDAMRRRPEMRQVGRYGCRQVDAAAIPAVVTGETAAAGGTSSSAAAARHAMTRALTRAARAGRATATSAATGSTTAARGPPPVGRTPRGGSQTRPVASRSRVRHRNRANRDDRRNRLVELS